MEYRPFPLKTYAIVESGILAFGPAEAVVAT